MSSSVAVARMTRVRAAAKNACTDTQFAIIRVISKDVFFRIHETGGFSVLKNEIDSTSRLQRVTNELIGSNQVENDLVCVSNVHKYYIHVTDIFRHHQDIASTFKVESGLGN